MNTRRNFLRILGVSPLLASVPITASSIEKVSESNKSKNIEDMLGEEGYFYSTQQRETSVFAIVKRVKIINVSELEHKQWRFCDKTGDVKSHKVSDQSFTVNILKEDTPCTYIPTKHFHTIDPTQFYDSFRLAFWNLIEGEKNLQENIEKRLIKIEKIIVIDNIDEYYNTIRNRKMYKYMERLPPGTYNNCSVFEIK